MKKRNFFRIMMMCVCFLMSFVFITGCNNTETPQDPGTNNTPATISEVVKKFHKSSDSKITQKTTYKVVGVDTSVSEDPMLEYNMTSTSTSNFMDGELYYVLDGILLSSDLDRPMAINIQSYMIDGDVIAGLEDVTEEELAQLDRDSYYGFDQYTTVNAPIAFIDGDAEPQDVIDVQAYVGNVYLDDMKGAYDAVNELYMYSDLFQVIKNCTTEVEMEYIIKTTLIDNPEMFRLCYDADPIFIGGDFLGITYYTTTVVDLSATVLPNGNIAVTLSVSDEEAEGYSKEVVEFVFENNQLKSYSYNGERCQGTTTMSISMTTEFTYGHFEQSLRPTAEVIREIAENAYLTA